MLSKLYNLTVFAQLNNFCFMFKAKEENFHGVCQVHLSGAKNTQSSLLNIQKQMAWRGKTVAVL